MPRNQVLFLDYFNNFLTVRAFADYYCMTGLQAMKTIRKGRAIHESQFGPIV